MHSHSVLTTGAAAARTERAAPWTALAVLAAALLAAPALLLALAALGQPLPEANTYPDLYYPFFLAPLGVALATLGAVVRARRPDSRWAALVALLGVAWSVNALLVAGRSLAATGAGTWLPQATIAWLEDWFYLLNDFGTIVFLVMLYPDVHPRGAWRPVVAALAAVVALMALAGMFAAGPLDGTGGLLNPLGIPGTHWAHWAVGNVGYPAVLLGGLVAMVARAVVAAFHGPEGRRLARYLGAMITLLVAGHVWTFATSAERDPGTWVMWFGFAGGLLAMVAVGIAGLLRRDPPVDAAPAAIHGGEPLPGSGGGARRHRRTLAP